MLLLFVKPGETFPCLKLSVARFQDFGNFHGCGLPNTKRGMTSSSPWNMIFLLSWKLLVEWAWYWGWTLFKWWNLVLICWTLWAACDAVIILFAILLAPIPWTTLFVAQLQISCPLSLSTLFPVLFPPSLYGRRRMLRSLCRNKWSVWGILINIIVLVLKWLYTITVHL